MSPSQHKSEKTRPESAASPDIRRRRIPLPARILLAALFVAALLWRQGCF